jgi:hypothetical protein
MLTSIAGGGPAASTAAGQEIAIKHPVRASTTGRLWVIGPNCRMATSLALLDPQRALKDARSSRRPKGQKSTME